MRPISFFLHNPFQIVASAAEKVKWAIPDKMYLKILFRSQMGKKLNLNNPQTFSEKLQWLKLYDRRPEYTTMVDKYAVKDYVASIIGEEYIIPTIGVWDSPEKIDWDKLPSKFVLKCTHDSGGLVICKNKDTLDKESAIAKLHKSLKHNYYLMGREWPYKNVPRKIIAEKYISPAEGRNDLPDYKFFCFNGEPKFCQVISGRGTRMSIDFFDCKWNHMLFHEPKNFPFAEIEPKQPICFDEMLRLASQLADGKSFSRIDFYDVNGKVYFGEITFYPTSGMGGFNPESYDKNLGQMISLPELHRYYI